LMTIRLIDIFHQPGWETRHAIRALEINGKCRVYEELIDLKRSNPADFKKLMKVIRKVACQERVMNEKQVVRGKGWPEVYEIRAHRGNARLYFFYTPDNSEIVVCTNSYWKSKRSKKEQDEAFQRADRLRQRYLESLRP